MENQGGSRISQADHDCAGGSDGPFGRIRPQWPAVLESGAGPPQHGRGGVGWFKDSPHSAQQFLLIAHRGQYLKLMEETWRPQPEQFPIAFNVA